MARIGLIINPVAGMGGTVGLKGTDNNVAEARQRGAIAKSGQRAGVTLSLLAGNPEIEFLTCSGLMGEVSLIQSGVSRFRVVYRYKGESTAEDTKRAARRFLDEGIDLLLFCGGDGTARDIFEAVGREVPILGIPAGVKMYSGVFALDPVHAAEIAGAVPGLPIRDAEIMDVNEEAYRSGRLQTTLAGIARVPVLRDLVQLPKQVMEEQDDQKAKEDIARFIAEIMLPGTTYVLGAGTTTEQIARRLGLPKTLLGIDVVRDGKLVAMDADERALLRVLEPGQDVRIIVSPIGAQGFVLGRGNQQISPEIMRKIGTGKIIVVATPQKLAATPVLRIDTGDRELDAAFGSYVSVISGYRIAQRKRLIW